MAILAPRKAVNAPVQAIVFITAGISSNTGNIRAIKNTPAATIVAAWINAEMGVGPSIASGSHTWRGNCADFAAGPINTRIANRMARETLKPPDSTNSLSLAPISVNSNVPVAQYKPSKPSNSPKSPTRLVTKAFWQASAAPLRSNQKPISK